MSTTAFWTGYVQGAFQETTFFEDEDGSVGDGDPDTELVEGTPVGATPYISDAFGSLIFVESLRDYVASPVSRILCPDLGSFSAKTVAHEIVHQFTLQHSAGAMMAQGCDAPRYFSAFSLGVIRSRGLE